MFIDKQREHQKELLGMPWYDGNDLKGKTDLIVAGGLLLIPDWFRSIGTCGYNCWKPTEGELFFEGTDERELPWLAKQIFRLVVGEKQTMIILTYNHAHIDYKYTLHTVPIKQR